MGSNGSIRDRGFSRIGAELLRKAVLYAFLFIVVSAGISVLVAYNREQARVKDLISRIRLSERAPLSEALWMADMRMLEIQLDSLIRHPLVAFAGVQEGDSIVASAGAQPPGRVRRETFPLTFVYDEEVRRIGELVVTLSLRPAYGNAIESGLLGSLYPTAAILAVGFLLYASFHNLVIGRLLQISSYLRSFESTVESKPLELHSPGRKASSWDELDNVARADKTRAHRG